jgi:diguanylate cyclase (GGDEF)-like protein
VKTLRASDVECRYGGDEFILVLPDTPMSGAQQVANGIRQAIAAQTIEHNSEKVSVTVSIGLVRAEPSELNVEALIERADRALYRAKQAGRNCLSTTPGSVEEAVAAVTASAAAPFRGHDLGLTA